MIVKHYGKLGDIVYCMAAMKRIREVSGERIDLDLYDFHLSDAAVSAIEPLLHSQEYIRTVTRAATAECNVDFREWMGLYDHRRNAVQSSMEFAVEESGIEISLENIAAPWLHIDAADNGLTLLNWTGRHINKEGDAEPPVNWEELLDLHPDARFVGLPEDHTAFSEKFNCHIPFETTENLLVLARKIKGCDLFMGNQSSPLAIAHAIGKQVIAESSMQNPNCIFIGRGSTYLGVSAPTIELYGIAVGD